ncbi:MAG: transcription antitermination factor NusB [Rickettsiales bacterium]|jgi:transcription antitermination factor NusB|nr:transcription antitermination factor NusB [Rickettsiales bacterium]
MLDNELNHHNKHASRFIAVLSLYSFNMNENKSANLLKTSETIKKSYHMKDVFDLELSDEQLNEIKLYSPDEEFLTKLMVLSIEKKIEIEELIKSSLIERWNLNKLDQVIQSILKLAGLELLFHGDIPAKIIIDEYVSLTKSFYENNEAGFVNKVVDTMANKVRPAEINK